MATGKVILVTGSTEGIGKATVLELARRGWRVFATGRNPKKLEALDAAAKENGVALETLVLEVTSAESIAAARAEVLKRTDGRGVDALVNNAGYAETGTVAGLTPERLRAQLETNVVGLQAVTRAFLPEMMARRDGRIVNVSSIAGRTSMPLLGAYHASKYAVEGLSDALRMEVAGEGIRVVLIEPGAIKTRFNDTAMSGLGKVVETEPHHGAAIRRLREVESRILRTGARPEVVARTIARAVGARCPKARYVTPLAARFIIRLGLWTPTRLYDLFFRILLRWLGRGGKA